METGFIMGVLEVMKISSFIDSLKCPELAKRFSDKASITVNEMMRRTTVPSGTTTWVTTGNTIIGTTIREETIASHIDEEIIGLLILPLEGTTRYELLPFSPWRHSPNLPRRFWKLKLSCD
ncbi:hypothetical protein Tco_1139379 [Tanacetum coccineum]